MIVCHCHAVTDREIRRAALEGADSCREIATHCKAGSDCGGCRPHIELLLKGVHAHDGADARPATAAS